MEPYEFRLGSGEEIKYRARISKAAVIAIWAVIPALLLITFLTAYLPIIVKYSVESELRDALLEQLGLNDFGFGAMREALYMAMFSSLPVGVVKFVSGLAAAIIITLVLAWLGWASVYTYRSTRYALILTNTRVFAKAKDKVLDSEYKSIVNVAVAQSLFGRICGYGEIHVQTEKDAITVCNIANVKSLETLLWSKAEKD